MKENDYKSQMLLVIAFLITCIAIMSGNLFTKKISVQVGQIAKETIYAPFQVENEMARQRKQDLAERSVESIYKINNKVQQEAVASIERLFDLTMQLKTTDLAKKLNKTPLEVLREESPIGLYREEYETLLGASASSLTYMKEVCIQTAAKLFEKGIDSQNTNKTIELREMLSQTKLSITYQKIAQGIITSVLQPNVVLDEVATKEAKKLAREKVDPIYILQGEKIIEKGTIVTEETYNLLKKVGYLDTNKTDRYKQYTGIAVFVGMMFLLGLAYLYQTEQLKGLQNKQLRVMLMIYILQILFLRVMVGWPLVYMPFAIAPMLIALFIKIDIAVIFSCFLTLIAAVIHKGDIVFISYLAGIAVLGVLMMHTLQERNKMMSSALIVGLGQAAIYLALKLFTGADITLVVWLQAAISLLTGILSVLIVVGSLPLWETMFGLVTPMQLLELTNPNQPILKRLLLEATGTYYHSLLVANLAETAADAIGANPLMARVGGYYHDIGKLTCSNYFKENQVFDNPHDHLDPFKSYQIIVSHVTAGIALAEQYKLPNYVKDIIVQHHGTSTMYYFYAKAKQLQEEEVTEEQFQYEGPKPRTKEAALIMLADIVEASVRSMQGKIQDEKEMEKIVRKMIKQKLDEGQLDECPIYISDMEKIVHSFTKMLKGMYHERIQYPERT